MLAICSIPPLSFAAQWAKQIYAREPTLLMVYPLLDPTWKSDKPDPDLRSVYMTELGKAVTALNKVGAR